MSIRHTPSKPKTRVPLALRILLGLLALLIVCAGFFSLWNAHAVKSYNQASTSLTDNLKAARQPQIDVDKLVHAQQQVDTLFYEAQQGSFVLLPTVRQHIAHNAEISQAFTQALVQEQSKTQPNKNSKQLSEQHSTEKKDQDSQGLTPEQRQQVEDLLKRNQDLQNANPQPSNAPSKSSSNKQTKPW